MGHYPAYIATSPDQVLALPHYSDERWLKPQMIYGKECKTDNANYSDRLWQWGRDAAERATEACTSQGLSPSRPARKPARSAAQDRPELGQGPDFVPLGEAYAARSPLTPQVPATQSPPKTPLYLRNERLLF